MNVRELIKELRKFDPNSPVAFFYYDASYGAQAETVDELSLEKVEQHAWNSQAPEATSVVVLR